MKKTVVLLSLVLLTGCSQPNPDEQYEVWECKAPYLKSDNGYRANLIIDHLSDDADELIAKLTKDKPDYENGCDNPFPYLSYGFIDPTTSEDCDIMTGRLDSVEGILGWTKSESDNVEDIKKAMENQGFACESYQWTSDKQKEKEIEKFKNTK